MVRVMPNTACMVRAAATAYAPGAAATAADCDLVAEMFTSVGICERVREKDLDAVTGLSGSGPAYAFVAIEALADGGVRAGLTRATALRVRAFWLRALFLNKCLTSPRRSLRRRPCWARQRWCWSWASTPPT